MAVDNMTQQAAEKWCEVVDLHALTDCSTDDYIELRKFWYMGYYEGQMSGRADAHPRRLAASAQEEGR